MSFPMVTVADVAAPVKSAIASGPFGSAIGRKYFVPDGVPVIRGNNLTLGKERFVDDGFVFITEEKAQKHRACIVHADDIVFTAAGSLGQVGIIPHVGSYSKYFISNKQLKLTPDKNRFDPLFLYYWFSSAKVRNHFIGSNRGAAVPLITLGVLRTTPVPAAPLPIQRRIASILSAYDDLIENNTRGIAILEEMAQRLYKEWFVHFRFPGHEQAEFEGDLPKGWSGAELGDLVTEPRDSVRPEAVEASTPYVGLEHIPRRSITLREWSTASKVESLKFRFSENDILFGKIRPYFHKISLAPVDGIASSDAIILRARRTDFLPLALMCASSDAFVDHATQTSNGTKMPRANWRVLRHYPVSLPPDEVLGLFNGFVFPAVTQLKALNRKNANLRAQRDLLLPKLVSGEIDVSKAEEVMEVAA